MDRSGGGDFACGDQLSQLDGGRCKAPAPHYFYKYGKLVFLGQKLFSHLIRGNKSKSVCRYLSILSFLHRWRGGKWEQNQEKICNRHFFFYSLQFQITGEADE
ncbi:MAG TPA: hypothetical protein DER70_04675 [Lentisphaeria bacterium]|nr:hypothetical protein [Lentisphaeria bacterium]